MSALDWYIILGTPALFLIAGALAYAVAIRDTRHPHPGE